MEAPLRTCARLRRRIKKKCYQNISIISEWTRRTDNEFCGATAYQVKHRHVERAEEVSLQSCLV